MADFLVTQSGDFLVTQDGDFLITQGGGGSGVNTPAERAAAAHVKKPGKGVYPLAYGTALGRAAVGWSFWPQAVDPGGGGADEDNIRLGAIEAMGVRGFNTTLGGL